MTPNIKKTLWALTIYFSLSFFMLGVSAMMHYFIYPTFDKVHENISNFMDVFNNRIIFLFYIPSVLLLLSSISLFWFAPKNFSKWIIWISIVLSAISVMTIFFVLVPIQNSFSSTNGFEKIQCDDLLSKSLTFQLIPIVLQVLLAFGLLNTFIKNESLFAKWVFIIVFSLAFFTAGSDFTEKILNYPLWLKVSTSEWMEFRQIVHTNAFLWIYLLPAFLPLLLIILMFWFKPKPIKRKFIFIYFGLYLFISVISSVYFVPKLQIQLNKAYSIKLIEELIKMDFPLRFLPSLLIYALAVFMFIKVGQNQLQETKQ